MNPDPAQLPLRDIHAAASISWWPPAPGWWVVAILVVLGGYWLGRKLWVRYLTWRLRKQLKAEYAGIVAHFQSNRDGRLMLADSATFLRRLLVHIGKHQSLAGLVGEPWAEYLAAIFPGDEPMHDLCLDLAQSAYRPNDVSVEPELLLSLTGRWIDHCVLEQRARA